MTAQQAAPPFLMCCQTQSKPCRTTGCLWRGQNVIVTAAEAILATSSEMVLRTPENGIASMVLALCFVRHNLYKSSS